MDFGILLQAIGHVGTAVFLTCLIAGWIYFALEMIQNRVSALIIGILPVITVLTILKYHAIASS